MLRTDKISVSIRWERGLGVGVQTVLPGDVSSFRPVRWWRLPITFINEIRWVRQAIKSGEIHV